MDSCRPHAWPHKAFLQDVDRQALDAKAWGSDQGWNAFADGKSFFLTKEAACDAQTSSQQEERNALEGVIPFDEAQTARKGRLRTGTALTWHTTASNRVLEKAGLHVDNETEDAFDWKIEQDAWESQARPTMLEPP